MPVPQIKFFLIAALIKGELLCLCYRGTNVTGKIPALQNRKLIKTN